MHRLRLILPLVLAVVMLGGFLVLRGLGILAPAAVNKARPVPPGDQEIAWLHTATSGTTWERFVAGIHHIRRDWPAIVIEDQNAFPDQSAAVPEIAITLPGRPNKLWFRWYKLTSDAGIEHWVTELAGREPPPLALIGGGSSDRARDLAQALAAQQKRGGPGKPPLLLLTTATADELFVGPDQNELINLMEIYPGRSFRFCFTNRQMAEAVRDLLWSHPLLRPGGCPLPAITGVATVAGGDPWAALAMLPTAAPLPPPDVHVLEWRDDPYSIDLSNQFRKLLYDRGDETNSITADRLAYSVGDCYLPNRPEAVEIRRLVTRLADAGEQRQVLVLPAIEKPVRRVLRGLCAAAPQEVRSLTAVTGDSISFNVVFRDRALMWNLPEMPVPLLFFCHQNPADWPVKGATGSCLRTLFPNATDDELLNAEIVRVLFDPLFASDHLIGDADELRERLLARQPAFFGRDGNRLGGRGEHVVCLRPHFDNERVQPRATLEVWARPGGVWRQVKELPVEYPAAAGGTHGGF